MNSRRRARKSAPSSRALEKTPSPEVSTVHLFFFDSQPNFSAMASSPRGSRTGTVLPCFSESSGRPEFKRAQGPAKGRWRSNPSAGG
jgi:hypothetical protein